ncbi:MAG: hypothetical protein AB7F78_14010 [Hyphomicrobiaceae bacterium]
MQRRFGLALLIALAMGACSSASVETPGASPIRQRDDAFLPYREVTTSPFESGRLPGDRISGSLGARVDRKTGAATTYALLTVVYAERQGRRYETARNLQAEALPMRQVYKDGSHCRKLSGCVHAEAFQVDLPPAELRQALAAGNGYAIKLFGRAGAGTVFAFPKDTLAALFKAIDAPAAVAASARTTRPK